MSNPAISTGPLDAGDLRRQVVKSVHDHWRLYLLEGVVLIVLGLAAIAVPALAGLAVAIFIGWLFLVGGVFGLAMTVMGRHAPGFWWSLVSAVLAILVGGALIGWPLGGILSLTVLLTMFFVIDGVASIMLAMEHRRHSSGTWGWLVASGIVDLVLAAIILSGFPGTAAWAIGLLVGIDLIFGGSALVAISLKARSENP
jgi:uncharacterized membrane protein HdeD (DUF308 family)